MSFPLITLQPVVNARHGWVALALECADRLDAHTLGRVFCEFGLYDSLEGLPCIVPLREVPADLGEYIPAQDVILRLPAASCTDPPFAKTLATLQRDGFRLFADGLPAAGGRLPAPVSGIALPGAGGAPAAALPPQAIRLALGIDSDELFTRCRSAGFQWFAGNYPLHGPARGSGAGSSSSALLLKLLALVARDAETREIEAILKQDPNLSYQLLRLVNSVAFSLTQKIATFGQALQLLGRRQLQRWLQLLLYATPVAGSPSPLLPRAALRAALLEALLRSTGERGDILDRGFMAGMFSLLDALLGMPLREIVVQLNLADDLTQALLAHEGKLGLLLEVAVVAETSPAKLGAALAAAGITPEAWAETLAQSCHWAVQVSREAF